MLRKKILIIGAHKDLGQALPAIFSRAGFEVDAIVLKESLLRKSKFLTNYFETKYFEGMLQKISETNLDQYSLVVPFDDLTLKNILESDLEIEKKLKLLPVVKKENFLHLGSKIYLSEILAQNKVSTPKFVIAKDLSQALIAAEELGFPLMLKVDFSSGGSGVFECRNLNDIKKIEEKFFNLPVLLQEKIEGEETDLAAFYQDEKLIHFCYSLFEKTVCEFGPSSVRTYKQLSEVCNQELFQEMQNLGRALGANGFVNITAIKAKNDGKFYFFEADMRPNVWVDFTKFIGDDLAVRIRNYFEKGQVMNFPLEVNVDFSGSILAPHFMRISLFQILSNRHNVWKFMSVSDWHFILKATTWKWRNFLVIKSFLKKFKQLTRKQRRKVQKLFAFAY